jgi:hypothetical protein
VTGIKLRACARPWLALCWQRHRLIIVAAGLSLLPRLLAALAFRPALFTPDSFGYLAEGVHLMPGRTRPSGYPILLRALEPFHNLPLVTTVQHLMGIATAVLGYAVLRHWGLPAWRQWPPWSPGAARPWGGAPPPACCSPGPP